MNFRYNFPIADKGFPFSVKNENNIKKVIFESLDDFVGNCMNVAVWVLLHGSFVFVCMEVIAK